MKAALYMMLTVCGFILAYAYAEEPSLMREAIGMSIGALMLCAGAFGLRGIAEGGDRITDDEQ